MKDELHNELDRGDVSGVHALGCGSGSPRLLVHLDVVLVHVHNGGLQTLKLLLYDEK